MRVVDGDTVDLQVDLGFHMKADLRFRLLGVDTPELRPRKGTEEERAEERKRAQEAKAYVQEWMDERAGEWPLLIKTQKADGFGRWLAEIYCEDYQLSLSDQLIQVGLGEVYEK